MAEPRRTNNGLFLSGFFIGLVGGGVAAWLSTPYTGVQLRDMILGRSQAMKQQVEQTISQTHEHVREGVEKAKSTVGLSDEHQADTDVV